MFFAYWILWLLFVGLIIWNLYDERDTYMRFAYSILLIPFLLRVLMLK